MPLILHLKTPTLEEGGVGQHILDFCLHAILRPHPQGRGLMSTPPRPTNKDRKKNSCLMINMDKVFPRIFSSPTYLLFGFMYEARIIIIIYLTQGGRGDVELPGDEPLVLMKKKKCFCVYVMISPDTGCVISLLQYRVIYDHDIM